MRKLEVFDMHRMSVDEFRESEKMPLTVVLDNVRSMHNVGSVLRTADAFRVERVVMCGITSTPPHPELHKTALGAEDSVEWEYAQDTLDVVRRLHDEGYTVYVIEQCEGSVMLSDFDLELGILNFDSELGYAKRLALPRTLTLNSDSELGTPKAQKLKNSKTQKLPVSKTAIILGNEVHGVQQCVVDACDAAIEIPQFGTKHSLNVSVTAGIVIWEMARRMLLTCLLLLFTLGIGAQEIVDNTPLPADMQASVSPTWHMLRKPVLYEGEWIPVIIIPEIPIYRPVTFRNERERRQYDRLVRNVKKVLPLAKMSRVMLMETYEVLESMPPEQRAAHIKLVEQDIKKKYTPVMKKLSYSQGKLLIKLIDRECNQSSYQIVQAFLGTGRAFFYQVFAWTFRASLKKTYDPEGEDALVEQIVRQVEVGAI